MQIRCKLKTLIRLYVGFLMVDKILTHEPAGNFVAQKAMHELAEILNAQAFKENLMHASKLKF